MADEKLTALAALANPTSDDLIYVVDDAGGTPASKKATLGSGLMSYGVCQGRLTLTSNTPVTTSDVTAATGVYYTPYVGNQIGLYSASGTWSVLTFTETSLSLNGYTASKPYDIFAYDNAGTLALESLIWTDGTTRATALAYQNGILVKSGDATRRYIGTIYINSTGGQTEDTVVKRFVWNYYCRVSRQLFKYDDTSHTYNVSTARRFNNDSSMQLDYVIGVAEDAYRMSIVGYFITSNAGYASIMAFVVDGVGTPIQQSIATLITAYGRWGMSVSMFSAIGYHYNTLCEYGSASATHTFALMSGSMILKG